MTTFYAELVEKMTNPMKQKPYKESSVKPIYRYLTTLNGSVPPTSLDYLLDRPMVMKFLEKYEVGTQRTILFAIRNVAKDFQREDILKVWKENIDDAEAGKGRLEVGQKSEAQKKAYALLESDKGGDAWESVLKRVEEVNKNAKGMELVYAIANLYTMFPPRRNLDYTEMKISTDYNSTLSKEFNYLVIGIEGSEVEMRFVFNRYKTDGTYRQQVFDVPEDLTTVLKRYIFLNSRKDGEFLLKRQAKLQSDDITEALHKVIGSGISTQMLRHMYLDKYNTPEREAVIHEMMGDAEKMAHSITTQQGVYVKK